MSPPSGSNQHLSHFSSRVSIRRSIFCKYVHHSQRTNGLHSFLVNMFPQVLVSTVILVSNVNSGAASSPTNSATSSLFSGVSRNPKTTRTLQNSDSSEDLWSFHDHESMAAEGWHVAAEDWRSERRYYAEMGFPWVPPRLQREREERAAQSRISPPHPTDVSQSFLQTPEVFPPGERVWTDGGPEEGSFLQYDHEEKRYYDPYDPFHHAVLPTHGDAQLQRTVAALTDVWEHFEERGIGASLLQVGACNNSDEEQEHTLPRRKTVQVVQNGSQQGKTLDCVSYVCWSCKGLTSFIGARQDGPEHKNVHYLTRPRIRQLWPVL